MPDEVRCTCARCRLHGLMGPAILITIGVLFLIQQFSNRFSFGELWPVILIVIGAVKLLEATASTAGHVEKEKGA
jgi:cell shape-determining protein MreD